MTAREFILRGVTENVVEKIGERRK